LSPLQPTLLRQIRMVIALLDDDMRRKLGRLTVAMMLVGTLELLSLGLFLPLFQAIVDPTVADRYGQILRTVGLPLGVGSVGTITAFMGVVALVFVIKNTVQLIIVRYMNRFIFRKQAEFMQRLFASILQRDYEYHLRVNAALTLRNLTISSVAVFSNGVLPFLNLVMEMVTIVAVLAILIFAEPYATIVIAACLAAIGYGTQRLLAPRLARWGLMVNDLSTDLFRWITETFGAIKSVKVARREQFFEQTFASLTDRRARVESNLATAIVVPRLVVESAIVVLLALVVVILFQREANGTNIVPIIGLYGIACMRLMPSVNRVLSQISMIKIGVAAVEAVRAEMHVVPQSANFDALPAIGDGIELHHVDFTFEGATGPTLRDIDLTIRPGEAIALVGPSGAGKSTLVDLLIGLLAPSDGTIRVGGAHWARLPVGWSGRVGYVPQSVFLVDDTVRRNIAFGVPDHEVDTSRLERAIALANLGPVIDGLERGVDSLIGENGRRLSGGQRQRIGIARALYDSPDLLVLDEATSALDLETERAIVDAIARLKGRVTTIIIAHHPSTVRKCDRIVVLEGGRIVAEGTFDEVSQRNDGFRRMAVLGSGRE